MSQKNIYILRQINVVTHLPDLCGVFEKALLISLDIRQYILALGLFLLFLIEAQLIYNVVPIPAVQQSDSFIHICTFFFLFFSIMVYHRILNIVPYMVGSCCLFILQNKSLHLLIPNSQSIPLLWWQEVCFLCL